MTNTDGSGDNSSEHTLPCPEEEKFFRDIFEANSAIKLLIDPDNGQIADANPAACAFYGYSRDDFCRLTIFDVNVLPDYETRARLDRVISGEQLNFNFYHRRVDGEMRDVVVNSGMVDFRGRRVILSIIHDITDIKRAEAALRESHEQFLTVLNSMDAIIYVADMQTHEILFANQNMKDSFGDHVVGRKCWEVIHGYSKGPCQFCTNERLLDENGMLRGVCRWEYKSLKNDLWYQSLDRAIIWIDGRLVRISIAIDITDRKRLEQEIISISEKERIRIGHDLHDGVGQYFTGIGYLTKILKDKLDAYDLPEKEVASEVLELVEEAKNSTRILARGLSPVNMDKSGIIMAVKELCMDTKKIFHSQCNFLYDHSIVIDDNFIATHLYYIIRESVNNAMRHGSAKNIDIIMKEYEDGIIIEVEDDGTGIDLDEKSRGLGLNLMKYRADLIGGTLKIDRNENGGTTVSCILPGEFKQQTENGQRY